MKNILYIKAGAGSGKTYSLTQELTGRIKNGNVKASEVLLTTFTKAAAAEIKERSRAELLKAGQSHAAKELEQATIGTVHSVALKFIQKYWYKLGIGPTNIELDDQSKSEYVNKSLAGSISDTDIEFFNKFIREFDIQSNPMMGDPESPYDLWRVYLRDIIEQMETFQVKDLNLCKADSKRLIDELFCLPQAKLDAQVTPTYIKDILKEYLTFMNSLKTSDIKDLAIKNCNELNKILDEEMQITLPSIHLIYKIFKKPAGGQKYKKYNSLAVQIEQLLRYHDQFLESEIIGSRIKEYIDHIFDIAENWRTKFIQYKKENHLIDFNDMERLFIQLLNMPEVRKELSESIKLVMVDEFQDSNVNQIQIFDKLSEIAQESIWVGDAKQAIYGFRGSDTEQTKMISDQFGKPNNDHLTTRTLEESWRSSPSIVGFTNELFSMTFGTTLPTNEVELKAHKTIDTYSPSIYQWIVAPETLANKNKIKPTDKTIFKIKSLLEDPNNEFGKVLSPSDIAILCRKNSRVEEIGNLLKDIGLPVNTVNDNILTSAEVQLVISILKYIADNHNDLAKAEILHLLYNIDTEELLNYRLHQAEEIADKAIDYFNWAKYDQLLQPIYDLSRRIRDYSVPDIVQAIIIELDLFRESRKWHDDIRRKDNLISFIQEANQYDQLCITQETGSSVSGFLSYLDNLEKLMAKNTDANCITVTTFHGAKGLEWNIVILDQLDYNELEENRLMRNFLFSANAVEIAQNNQLQQCKEYFIRFVPRYISTYNAKSRLPGDQMDILMGLPEMDTYKNKLRHEANRLLYVGVTRAKEALILINPGEQYLQWPIVAASCNQNLSEMEKLESAQNIIQSHATEVNIPANIIQAPTLQNQNDYLKRDLKTHTEKKSKYLSPSKAETKDISSLDSLGKPIIEATNPIRVPIHCKNEELALVGTCIHNIFAFYHHESDKQEKIRVAQKLIDSYQLTAQIPDAGQLINSIEFLYDYLSRNYGEAIEIHHEWAFAMKLNDQIIKGEMDLVWETKEGYVLIDYKNFPGSTSEIMDPNDKNHASKYIPQLTLYKEAIESSGKKVLATYIYYSVIGDLVKF